jgi:hypothetical protein
MEGKRGGVTVYVAMARKGRKPCGERPVGTLDMCRTSLIFAAENLNQPLHVAGSSAACDVHQRYKIQHAAG